MAKTTKKQKVYRVPRNPGIRYFGESKEMYHPEGFRSTRNAADDLAAQSRRRGYKARVVASVSSTGKKGWTVWESRYAR